MIVVTLNDVLKSVPILNNLSKQSMPAKTAFKIMKIIKEVNKQLDDFNQIKQDLISTYGERDEMNNLKIDENNNYIISNDNKENFSTELTEILNERIEICIPQLKLDDLDFFHFSPQELEKIEYCIKEE